MEWIERLNAAVGYIEANLAGEVDYAEAARIAYCSPYHFQRMFSYLADMPLSEYIRRRRMTLAAFDLRHGEKVLDVALKYGYDSPTAFNRAFQSVHRVSPTMARADDIALRAYPKISFTISVKGDAEMNYRIVKKDAFRIVGVKKSFPSDIEQSFQMVPLFWKEAKEQGVVPRLCDLMDGETEGLMGVCSIPAGTEFDYYIAVASSRPAPEDMAEYEVPACTWAVFECMGKLPDAIQNMQKRVVTEWLPTSGYEYADAPDIEVYSVDSYKMELWLPVEEKA